MPTSNLIDPTTLAFVPLAEARKRLRAVGTDRAKRIIAYCGGGISATVALFLLHASLGLPYPLPVRRLVGRVDTRCFTTYGDWMNEHLALFLVA